MDGRDLDVRVAEEKLVCQKCGEEVDELKTCMECENGVCLNCMDYMENLCLDCAFEAEEEDELDEDEDY